MVRVKRALRAVKDNMIEFSLSEVLELTRPHEQIPNFCEMISADIDVREKFITDTFQRFYKVEKSQVK